MQFYFGFDKTFCCVPLISVICALVTLEVLKTFVHGQILQSLVLLFIISHSTLFYCFVFGLLTI